MTGDSYVGQANYQTPGSDFNVIDFMINQRLAAARFAALATVVSCTNAGGLSPVGFVTVQPLVDQVDGAGNVQTHPQLFNVPYLRIQGGLNAVIIDPQKGDIGLVVYCDRDISVVKANAPSANPQTQPPGSRRQHDLSDGVYLGGYCNRQPTQYTQYLQDGDGNPNGINIVSPVAVSITAPNVTVTASSGVSIITPTVAVQGDITATGSITAGQGGADQVGLQTHEHPTAATGAPSAPTPGT